jgi:serine O-acetyltransferase
MSIKNIYRMFFVPNHNVMFLLRLTKKLQKNGFIFLSRCVRYRIIYKYGIHISSESRIGQNLVLPHPQGIIIGDGAIIGDDCTIYHQVTLGKKRGALDDIKDYPIIGNNVVIFPGAKIIGGIKVGSNSIIAPNSVVINDVEPNSVYAGIPAKKIGDNEVVN